MSTPVYEARDVKTNGLRKVCAAIDEVLTRLPVSAPAAGAAATPAVADELRAQWAKLVSLLALEPAHRLRECPACKHVCMMDATRCGHCWAKLSPDSARLLGDTADATT